MTKQTTTQHTSDRLSLQSSVLPPIVRAPERAHELLLSALKDEPRELLAKQLDAFYGDSMLYLAATELVLRSLEPLETFIPRNKVIGAVSSARGGCLSAKSIYQAMRQKGFSVKGIGRCESDKGLFRKFGEAFEGAIRRIHDTHGWGEVVKVVDYLFGDSIRTQLTGRLSEEEREIPPTCSSSVGLSRKDFVKPFRERKSEETLKDCIQLSPGESLLDAVSLKCSKIYGLEAELKVEDRLYGVRPCRSLVVAGEYVFGVGRGNTRDEANELALEKSLYLLQRKEQISLSASS